MKRRKRVQRPAPVDFGPVERLARGDVMVEGERPYRRARVVDVISRMGDVERRAAAHLLALFEVASFSGFKCAAFEPRSGRGSADISDAACRAREELAMIAEALDRRHWGAIWYVLFFGESQIAFAFRYGIRRASVGPLLAGALRAVADIREGLR